MNRWKSGILGLAVADALGVPVEFMSREQIVKNPVTDMREYGTHNQPKGTWSDDSSMVFATMDSLAKVNAVDYKDLMERFVKWAWDGEYTPFGEVFDIGISTSRAILAYGKGTEPLNCGGIGERENGNGSLMRILPVCLYLLDRKQNVCMSDDEVIQIIHNVSALTHAHIRSQMACSMYYFCVKAIVKGLEKEKTDLKSSLQKGLDQGFSYYRRDFRNYAELDNYSRLMDLEKFGSLAENEIRSSGYVVSTLEAAIWCLLNTDSYKEAVLKAVNLGDDTDTVGAVTGGLAGLYYGIDAIPAEWLECLQKREWIEKLISDVSK